MADPGTLIIMPAVVMGGAIGLIELFFVHADERGMGWLSHGIHALPATISFVFISMNIGFAMSMVNLAITENMWVDLGIRALIAVIAMAKIAAAAAIAGRVGEKFVHTAMIGGLIFAAPYAWGLVGPMMPAFLQ